MPDRAICSGRPFGTLMRRSIDMLRGTAASPAYRCGKRAIRFKPEVVEAARAKVPRRDDEAPLVA